MNWRYVILAIICYGIWGFVEKMVTKHMTPFVATAVAAYVWSAVAPGMFLWAKATNKPIEFDTIGTLWVVGSVLAAGFGSFFVLKALEFSSAPGAVNAVICTYPALTLILCALFLHETITLYKVFGMLLIIAGIAFLG